MKKKVFIGLSSPTFYDYLHTRPRKVSSDLKSSPNPILENAVGLAIFYDEIWFACESLCPETIRQHPKVKFLERDLCDLDLKACITALKRKIPFDGDRENQARLDNSKRYWEAVSDTGAYWGEEEGRRIDNHSHALKIGSETFLGSSNRADFILSDLDCANLLEMDLALNTFNLNIYNAIFPNQFDPLIQATNNTICSSALINCSVPNAITRFGPDDSVFDFVSTSSTSKDFRKYISDRSPDDAYRCYSQFSKEIDSHIKSVLKRSAYEVRPFEGLAKVFWDALRGVVIPSPVESIGKWYLSQVEVPPNGAAAFLYDLKSRK